MPETKTAPLEFGSHRVAEILRLPELMASGDTEKRLQISDGHDELDAIAYAVNVLVGELEWTSKLCRRVWLT
jgi:hypothetical protein